MATTSPLGIDLDHYKWGFHDPEDKYVFKARKGLDAEVINQLSHMKGEPDWMRAYRLHAYEHYRQRPTPKWGGNLDQIDFEDIYYYLKPTEGKGRTWEDVPEDIKRTFDRLGIPEAEKKFLAGVGAQYECLSAEARVYTARGLVPIQDVRPGDTVFSFDEATNRLIPARVKARDFKGEREILEVRVGTRIIKATANHPFLVLENCRAPGKRRGRFRRTWKYLHELKVGDLVAVAKKLPDVGQPYELQEAPRSRRHAPISLPRRSSADLMWWLGLYMGDGFVHREGTKARVEFAVPESDDSLRGELRRVTQTLFGVGARNGDRYRVTVYSSVLAQYVEANGFAGGALTKRVPDWVFELPQDQILAFLGGYVDADGYVRDATKNHDVVLTSGNRALLQGVQGLTALCGLPTSAIHRFESKHPNDAARRIVGYRMQVTGDFERIACRSRQRTARFGRRRFYHDYSSAGGTTFRGHTNEFVGFAKITSIMSAGMEPVYDIEVDGPHNFVAEGFIVHNSESVYHNLKEEWEKLGVIFLDTDSALREHPDIVKEYFGTVVPPEDNKLAALNSAVWSGGSFVYIPEGVHVDIPLQAYFRINAEKAGQFERTMIICEPGSYVHYVEGCTAPIYTTDSLHSAVVEIIVKEGARCRYTTIQNWSTNTYNLVTKRAVAYRDATMEWVDGNIGCLTGDSRVLLNPDIKPISEVSPGDTVYSVNGGLNLTRHKVIAKQYSGKQSVFRLRTEDHREIRATANHPFLVLSNRGGNHSPEWRRLDELTADDRVAVAGDAPEHPVRFSKIASIEPEGVEDTWDLEIADSHNFIADGFVVHNSKLTMKYPSVFMVEPGAKAEILSIAFAGKGQHQDPGGKVIHAAPHTQSSVVSKSISKDGGRAGYRGLVKIYPGAHGSKCAVRCDALILDDQSRSDTYPTMEIEEEDVQITHEATVSKVSDEQLFYLMARGIKADEAMGMIVRGFIEPIMKELPLEYAVELNRLIALEMEGSVG